MKNAVIFFLIVMVSPCTVISAQIRTAHYEIITSGGSGDIYALELEQRFAEYNKVFRFNPALLTLPLKVRVFADKNAYDSYVAAALGSRKSGAVYLHYRNSALRELVIHSGSAEEDFLVPHQAFIQFLRAFIPEPPPWIREGFAVYFNTLKFDRSKGILVYEENLSWLETVKRSSFSAESVMRNAASFPNMQAFSWALVSFFMGGSDNYYRSLTDSFMVLSPPANAEENTRLLYERIILFNSIDVLTGDFTSYIAGKKTFAELVEEGQQAYAAKNYSGAEESFRKAAELRSGHYAPYYYLALIAYENKKYSEAENFYKTALDNGGERALIQYARGINAAAAGGKTEAITFLEEAAAADSAKYKERCSELIKKLQ